MDWYDSFTLADVPALLGLHIYQTRSQLVWTIRASLLTVFELAMAVAVSGGMPRMALCTVYEIWPSLDLSRR
jgi:hypothetical protein